ncbi:hypothetical protein ACTXT7_002532 [Hymenolepis weldensis]
MVYELELNNRDTAQSVVEHHSLPLRNSLPEDWKQTETFDILKPSKWKTSNFLPSQGKCPHYLTKAGERYPELEDSLRIQYLRLGDLVKKRIYAWACLHQPATLTGHNLVGESSQQNCD